MWKRMVEWLTLETWGHLCVFGWHSWRRGASFYDKSVPVNVFPIRGQMACRWCGVAGPEVYATAVESEKFRATQWEEQRVVDDLIPTAHTYAQLPYHEEDIKRVLFGPSRKPAGPSKASALPLHTREQVEKLRETWRPDEVAAQVMEASVGRTEPLVPRKWSVEGVGPMLGGDE